MLTTFSFFSLSIHFLVETLRIPFNGTLSQMSACRDGLVPLILEARSYLIDATSLWLTALNVERVAGNMCVWGADSDWPSGWTSRLDNVWRRNMPNLCLTSLILKPNYTLLHSYPQGKTIPTFWWDAIATKHARGVCMLRGRLQGLTHLHRAPLQLACALDHPRRTTGKTGEHGVPSMPQWCCVERRSVGMERVRETAAITVTVHLLLLKEISQGSCTFFLLTSFWSTCKKNALWLISILSGEFLYLSTFSAAIG